MKPRLNVVTIGVNDLKVSREFYRSALGWKPANGSDESIVFYAHGGIVFGLYPLDKLAEDAMVPFEMPGFSGITLAINQESKADVDELYERIIKNGGKSLVAPRDTFWGGYDCYFSDPDGHVWEIAWAPFWKFDGQGSLVL
jgi:hypothetical protein